MRAQAEKASAFRALHEQEGAFLIPNPWDAGSARLLERLGFEALATTSGGHAFSLGRRDNTVSRDEALSHVRAVASATSIPLSADLEHGYGDDPETVAETIRRVAAEGAVGGSIEDYSRRRDDPIYPLELSVKRVRAAAQAARSLPFPFLLTARADNYLVGRTNLKDTIRRLQAYQDAGAHVLYAPDLPTKEEIEAVVRSVDLPVNVVMGSPGLPLSVSELARMGVKRISVGTALCRAALNGFLRGAREMREKGTFSFADEIVSFGEISSMFE